MPIRYLDPYPAGKRAVLLLHGLGADGESWGLQFPALAGAGFRPLAVDLPGFGASPAPAGRWRIRVAARAAAGILEPLGIEQADVVGLSMGGVAAQLIALETPHLVRRLVLVSTFACLRPKVWSETAYLLRRFAAANLRGVRYQAAAVAWRVFPDADQVVLRDILVQKILTADPKVYRAAMRGLALFDSRPHLTSIRQPTLIISGEHDTTVPPQAQCELTAIPGSRQVIIPGGNHAVIADQPEAFNQALLAFLLD